MTTYLPENVSIDQLLLDPNNYRFQGERDRRTVAEKRFSEDGVQTAALNRLKADGLAELKQSILSNGFVPVERIVVRLYESDDAANIATNTVDKQDVETGIEQPEPNPQKYVVLEGNRRAASLKWLQQDDAAGIDITLAVAASLKSIPVLVLESEDESAYLSIMGIRHVGGIKEWGGYQSARLVYELRHDHGLTAQDAASRLALSATEINRRYRAFQAMEQMKESDEHGEETNSELYPLFHEALVSPRVRTWLGWNEDTYRFDDEEQREIFYSLISPYVDTKGVKRPPKLTSYSEVRDLKGLLDNEEAVQSLVDLEKPFSDASALVKSADINKNWLTKVNSAISALDHMGIRESKQLAGTQLVKLRELSELISQILDASSSTDEPT